MAIVINIKILKVVIGRHFETDRLIRKIEESI